MANAKEVQIFSRLFLHHLYTHLYKRLKIRTDAAFTRLLH